jgi:PAS domain S-box-containing protein
VNKYNINEQISNLEQDLKENLSQSAQPADEYFRQLFNVLPDAVMVHQGGFIIFANSAAAQLYGAESAESLLGMRTLDFVHPDDKELVEKRQKGMLAGNEGAPLLAQRRVRLDGEVVDVEVSVRPIEWEGQRSIVVVSRDISERVKTEKALREKEEQLQSISTNLPGMMYQRVLRTDGTVEFPYMSEGVLDVLGIDAQSALENPAQLIDIIHPDDRDRYFEGVNESAKTLEQLDIVFRITQPGGSERWVRGVSRPRTRQDGAIVWDALMFDISMRKQTELDLRASEVRYRRFLEGSPDAIYVHSNDQILYANPTAVELFGGKTSDDIVGLNAMNLYHPDELPKLAERRETIKSTGIMKSLTEFQFKRLDGSSFHGEATAATVDWEGAASIFVNVRDVTRRKKFEERLAKMNTQLTDQADELQRSNSDLEQFAYIASHDLQEPLRMISGYCQLLQRRYKDKLDQDANEFIEFAVEGAGRMQRLISDILMYSRVGTRAKQLEKLQSQEIFQGALANLMVVSEEADAVITADDLPEIMGDSSQLGQLFQNLIGNAIKFRGDKTPEINVAATRKGDEWEFSVSDNGIGIEPEHRDRIFLIFQRLHTRAEYEGTGIGLAVCQKIVARHGGSLQVEESDSGGSKFVFTLPASGD